MNNKLAIATGRLEYTHRGVFIFCRAIPESYPSHSYEVMPKVPMKAILPIK